MSRTRLPIVLACLWACAPAQLRAEASLGVVSDYRYRGVSLSDGHSALQAGLVWNRDDGWYAGVFAANTRIARADGWQLVSYLGRAWRLDSGRSWEAGVQFVAFTSHHDEDYREVYLGFASDRWSLRAYYQPKPFGDYGPAVYAEGNASLPLGGHWLLLGHMGAGWRGGELDAGVDRTYLDARIGTGVGLGAFSLYLQHVWMWRRSGYLADDLGPQAADPGWVLGVNRAW